MPEKRSRRHPGPEDERSVDYLICKQCNSPCYVFETEKGHVTEAQCEVCGNEDLILFNIAEEEDE